MKNDVVFEDDHLVCIAQPGHRRDCQIITFSEMLMRPTAQNAIWAGSPIQKLGYPAIGFVAKTQNWFPQSSVHAALKHLDLGEAPGTSRIGYGYSMGGWAVLFYAKALGLDATLSFSPQFSIDPDEISDRRFSKFFRPDLNAGMAITASTAAPTNLVICDPHDAGDHESALKIRDEIDANLIRLAHVGHGSVKCITRTKTLGDILSCVQSGDLAKATSIIRSCRRLSPSRAMNIAHRAARDHPQVALAIYRAYPDQFPLRNRAQFLYLLKNTSAKTSSFEELCKLRSDLEGSHTFLAIFADYLIEMGSHTEASAMITKALEQHESEGYRFIAAKIEKARQAPPTSS